MEKKLRKLCEELSELDPPMSLCGFIFARIKKEKTRKAKRQLVFSYFGFAGSLILAAYVGTNFGQAFLQSEFWTMLSLVFSDLTIVVKNWNGFSYSLLETFPIMYTTALLLPVFLLLLSANFYVANKANLTHKYNQ